MWLSFISLFNYSKIRSLCNDVSFSSWSNCNLPYSGKWLALTTNKSTKKSFTQCSLILPREKEWRQQQKWPHLVLTKLWKTASTWTWVCNLINNNSVIIWTKILKNLWKHFSLVFLNIHLLHKILLHFCTLFPWHWLAGSSAHWHWLTVSLITGSLSHYLTGSWQLIGFLVFWISGSVTLLVLLYTHWLCLLGLVTSRPKYYIIFHWNRYNCICCCFSGKTAIFQPKFNHGSLYIHLGLNKSDCNLVRRSLVMQSGSTVSDCTASLFVNYIIAPMQAKFYAQLCEICPKEIGSFN